jgi:hypothetical protein
MNDKPRGANEYDPPKSREPLAPFVELTPERLKELWDRYYFSDGTRRVPVDRR